MAGQPKLADTRAATAMDALLKATDPATAPVHAVVSTEQQIYQRGSSLPDAKDKLASWLPPGPTAVADYPTVLLAGSWLSQEQVSAASEFARYLRKAEPHGRLGQGGLPHGGRHPAEERRHRLRFARRAHVGWRQRHAGDAGERGVGPTVAGPERAVQCGLGIGDARPVAATWVR